MIDRWYPVGAQPRYARRPEVGWLVGLNRTVWRITAVVDTPLLDDEDRDVWVSSGMPELDTWPLRPFRARAVYVGGKKPEGLRPSKEALMTVGVRTHTSWQVYPHGRWPQCSCCGEPMPCTAEAEDRAVEAAEQRIAGFEARLPGCCWGCGEPISQRQHTVTYAGTNLDLPTAEPAVFHTRRKCLTTAMRYEERWIEADSSRARILTWPLCPGTLVVHADGDNECHGGADDCWGHDSYDHHSFQTCYTQGHGCPRGCTSETHHRGCRPRPRQPRESEALS